MKKLSAREILWMTLPVVLLGGAAWWMGRGGKLPSPVAKVGQMAANVRRPSLAFARANVNYVSPTQAAFLGESVGASGSAVVAASASFGQIRPKSVPSFSSWDFVDENNHSIRKSANSLLSPTGTFWGTDVSDPVPDASYNLGMKAPFASVPPQVHRVTFTGVVIWGTSRPVPVRFEVMPVWIRRKASRLQVESVVWRSAPSSIVEVVCHLTNARKPSVFGINEQGAITSPFLGVGYNAKDREPTSSAKDDLILAEWSQRIESNDGRLNSLDLLKKHMEKETDKIPLVGGGRSVVPGNLVRSFHPLCQGPTVQIEKERIRLFYKLDRIPAVYKKPIFCCEIYLVGDGFVAVRCPLR